MSAAELADAGLYTCYVIRRARGVWLATWRNTDSGEDDADAFSTEAKAKAWCEQVIGANLNWSEVQSRGRIFSASYTIAEEE